MRADSEHVFVNSMESLKGDTKPHQRPENNWEVTEPKIPKKVKENACELFCDTRGDKLDKESDGNVLEHHSSEHLTDVMNGNSKEVHDSEFSAERDLLEKEGSVFYLDKNVTACDLPEIVVCYKDNTYHVVKDICVDEGVPVQEKFLFKEKDSCKRIPDQSGAEDQMKPGVNVNVLTSPVMGTLESKSSDISPVKVEEHSEDFCSASECGSKSLSTHIKDATDKASERDKEIPDVQESSTGNYDDAEESRKCKQENLFLTGEVKGDANGTIVKDLPTLDAPEISPKNDYDKHVSTHGESEDLSAKEEDNSAAITYKESLTLADIISMEDSKKHFNDNSDGPEEQSSQESSGKKSSENPALAPEVVETEDSKTNDVSPVTASKEASKDEKAKHGEENRSCSKNADVTDLSGVSTSQGLTKTVGPSKASHGDSGTGLRTNESQRLGPSEYYVPRHNYVLEDPNDHTFLSHFSSGLGETSFSAAEPVSGHITYSGPIAFSGSLSVRSDGSTTSTRSFAFPVLQSEWNSSPVRMAKADKRHLRSQKSWRHTLCCFRH